MVAVNQVGNALTGSTGSGAFVGANTPTLITPNIGAASGNSLTTSGAIVSTAGPIQSGTGAGGAQGELTLYPSTTASGYLDLLAVVNASGNFATIISNASAIGQTQTISIPNSGASTANFILSAAAATQTIGSALSVTGNLTPSQTNGIVGTTTNNSANAGSVGEYVSSEVAGGAGSGLTTATPANVTSISLTAGDWDVWGYAGFQPSDTTNIVSLLGGVSSTSATLGANFSVNQYGATGIAISGTQNISFCVPQQRFSLAATTTIYLVVNQVFSVSTMTRWGGIYARRRR